ncbi:MAG: GTP pyrophosphokinase [Gammaproteobacteria bacterium]|nr:GTP pyrophosphokinase [Gammaproteobacteria bacterium]
MSNLLEAALQLALVAHKGQKDKAGQPYILHPLRLMLKLQHENERIVALLHDVVEDSNISLDDLRRHGFSDDLVAAVDCLSRKSGESYDDFIQRISNSPLAIKVKIEDLKDNLDLTRLDDIHENDLSRLKKYHVALKYLLQQERTTPPLPLR